MSYCSSVNKLKPTFKKIILFSTLVVLVGIGMFFALAYPFEPKSSSQTLPKTEGIKTENSTQTPPMAQGGADGLQLTMTLEKTEYSLGEPIKITLTITNISNQTKKFGIGPDVNDFDFHVYNYTNSNIYWYSSRWIGAAIPYYIVLETLDAGESLDKTLVWQQTIVCPETVFSGTYYIIGSVGPPFFYGDNSTMETTPIQITIG